MKFKTTLSKSSNMKEFIHILATLAKQDQRIVMIARPESITLTVPQDPKRPLVWFDIAAATFFESYRMEGVYPDDPEHNLIYFEVNAAYLISALGGVKKDVDHIEIKLGKQEFPYFSVNLKCQSVTNLLVTTSNQVPLIVIPRIGWDDFKLPYEEDFDALTQLPRFSTFKRFIDTFKYSPKIRFIVRQEQTLSIEADQEPARHVTIFKVKRVEFNDERNSQHAAVSVLIEQKKLSQWLHSISIPTKIKLSLMIRSGKRFHLIFKVRDDILGSFMLPAEIDDDDEDIFGSDDSVGI